MRITDYHTPSSAVLSVSASVQVSSRMTKEEFDKATEKVPGHATMRISTTKADRPGESSYSTITYTWTL